MRTHPDPRADCHWSWASGSTLHWLEKFQTFTTRWTQHRFISLYVRHSWPLTCLTQRKAYRSVWSVLARPLLRLSAGRWYFSSFSALKSSFWVFAFADCSLLHKQQEHVNACCQFIINNYLLLIYNWHRCINFVMVVGGLPAAAGGRVVLLWTDQAESIVTTGRGKTLRVWAATENKEKENKGHAQKLNGEFMTRGQAVIFRNLHNLLFFARLLAFVNIAD